jgi:hypothetical protein
VRMSALYFYGGSAYVLSYASTRAETAIATLSALHTPLICEGLLHIDATFRCKTRKFSNIKTTCKFTFQSVTVARGTKKTTRFCMVECTKLLLFLECYSTEYMLCLNTNLITIICPTATSLQLLRCTAIHRHGFPRHSTCHG